MDRKKTEDFKNKIELRSVHYKKIINETINIILNNKHKVV